MEAQKSPLILNNFLLINHEYHFIQPENDENVNIPAITDQYKLFIDFAVNQIDKNLSQLFTKIGINNIDKPLPGYHLFIEGVCIFSFNEEEKLSDQNKSDLLYFSGLNICINSLRNVLATITSNGPFGKYTLPSIDVNKLLQDKQEEINKKKESK